LALSDAVLRPVARSVGWDRPYGDLAKSFESQADANGGTLTVTARARSAQEAYRLAQAWRDAFRAATLDLARQQLDAQIQAAGRRVAAEQAALDTLKATLDKAPGGPATSTVVSALAVGQQLAQAQGDRDRLLALRQSLDAVAAPLVLEDPRLPEAPVAPRKALNLAVALVLGLMAGVFAALLADFWARGRGGAAAPAEAPAAPSSERA
ncbi:MAG: hypothetical protein QJR14_00665, partial [Bacillota bacterium]|nr:hypothetical protein [Bacillota bacterium]